MKTLWTERFNPQPFEPVTPTESNFDMAWNWIFEKDADGEYVRAGLCLILIHGISKEFHRDGYRDTGQMAAVALWRRYSGQMVTSSIPKRKNPVAGIPSGRLAIPARR